MYLSPEADELIIMNRKPDENQPYDEAGMVNPEVLAYENQMKQKTGKKKTVAMTSQTASEAPDHVSEPEEECLTDRENFTNFKSSSSCWVDSIQGIVYGGMTSRFWMLRKHINSLSIAELKQLPFYAWNCITL